MDVVARDADPDLLWALADTTDGERTVHCVGLEVSAASFRIEVLDGEETLFRSAPIRVEVHPIVHGLRLLTEDGIQITAEDSLTLDAGRSFGPLELQYLDAEGAPISAEEVERFAVVELDTDSDFVSVEDPNGGGDLAFRVLAEEPGEASLDSRLVQTRTGRILWQQPLLRAHVRRVWNVFPDGPNFEVYDLVATPDGLVVGGSFSRVGDLSPVNVALFTREGWKPMGAIHGGVRQFAYDGTRLVASELSSRRVVEWTGESWIDTGVTTFAYGMVGLRNGEIVTLPSVEEFWLPPDGECSWALEGVRVVGNRLFAIAGCYGDRLEHSAALQEYVEGTWETVHLALSPGFNYHETVRFVEGCGESVYFSAGNLTSFPSGDVFRIDPGGNEPIPFSVPVGAMTCFGTDFYIVDLDEGIHRSSGGVETQLGSLPIASSISAIEVYDGEVFVAGRFREIDGFSTRNFASWKP
ncbi:MAG: hypothetical protein R3E97_18415 [Candidatus Eisenbacteria bacterium]